MRGLKKDKSPGVDNITAEEIQAAGQVVVDALYVLCHRIWDEEHFPQDWKKAVIAPLHKKNDKLCCDNYRGISLLSHCEVMAKVILQRIQRRTEEILSEAQAGFRVKRSTIDQLFTLQLLAEKYVEFGKFLYVCYVDFHKAFDNVWRTGLWRVMKFLVMMKN